MTRGSLRRFYLDALLKEFSTYLNGRVLDVGGKKLNKRGEFQPPSHITIEYLNIDESTSPDYLGSAESMHFFPGSDFDSFMMIEVLEHLKDPDKVICEINRVTKAEAVGIASIPFLYPIHGDPSDYQRYTPNKLSDLFSNHGFEIIKIVEMGGLASVVHDLLWSYNWRVAFKPVRKFNSLFISLLSLIAIMLDKHIFKEKKYITTGWIMLVKKRSSLQV